MAHRTFRDQDGQVWDVWDVYPTMAERRATPSTGEVAVERRRHSEPRAPLPPELRDGWLAFESNGERRRLTPAPPDWFGLEDEELERLLGRATLTGKIRRLIE